MRGFYFLWVVRVWYLDSGPGLEGHGNIVAMLVDTSIVSNDGLYCISVAVILPNPVEKYITTEGLTAADELRLLFLHDRFPMYTTPPLLGYYFFTDDGFLLVLSLSAGFVILLSIRLTLKVMLKQQVVYRFTAA